jgi:hypothetical protein
MHCHSSAIDETRQTIKKQTLNKKTMRAIARTLECEFYGKPSESVARQPRSKRPARELTAAKASTFFISISTLPADCRLRVVPNQPRPSNNPS